MKVTKNIYLACIAGAMLTLNACNSTTQNQQQEASNPDTENNVQKVHNAPETTTNNIPTVLADLETQPVSSAKDAADDPAIWVHPNNSGESTIIGTNKKKGLAVYDLSGKELFFYPMGKINNVDVRYGFPLAGKKVDIVAGSNRSKNSVGVWKVNPETKELEEVLARELPSKVEEVYGFCLYKSAQTQKFYAFVVSKTGQVEQWELFDKAGKIDGKIVRSFKLETQAEGMVADDELGFLYVAEETKGIWKYNAEPSASKGKLIVDLANQSQLAEDLEGLTIYYAADKKGYLIASSQGNNSYAVFDRGEGNAYLGSFRIGNGDKIDGTSDTDGIDVVSFGLGKQFPNGFFIAQDGTNDEVDGKANQNFKVVAWDKIVQSSKGKFMLDNKQNPRK
ncbi:phytase [uncultured Microscilla sp.]|uniref:phytase n=1 Tax=uncultured Microscilla sp. TaxID=432653 RepID=UPI0026298C2F|nr:phytase [uncultured Microscilla sp.]